jgi:hypothetical protein
MLGPFHLIYGPTIKCHDGIHGYGPDSKVFVLQVFERAPKSTIVFFLERFYINTGLANNPLYDDLANNPGLHPL